MGSSTSAFQKPMGAVLVLDHGWQLMDRFQHCVLYEHQIGKKLETPLLMLVMMYDLEALLMTTRSMILGRDMWLIWVGAPS
jgi:hypothetical protein